MLGGELFSLIRGNLVLQCECSLHRLRTRRLILQLFFFFCSCADYLAVSHRAGLKSFGTEKLLHFIKMCRRSHTSALANKKKYTKRGADKHTQTQITHACTAPDWTWKIDINKLHIQYIVHSITLIMNARSCCYWDNPLSTWKPGITAGACWRLDRISYFCNR